MHRFLRALCFLLVVSPHLYSLSMGIPEVKLKGDWLLGDLLTDKAFPLRVIGAIDDGIRIRVIFEFRLLRKSDFFLAADSVLFTKEFTWLVTRNLLEGTYVVRGSDKSSFAFRTRKEYLEKISKKQSFRLIRFAKLKKGAVYYLEGRVSIRSTKMYPPFSLLSVFSSETAWKRSGVIVP